MMIAVILVIAIIQWFGVILVILMISVIVQPVASSGDFADNDGFDGSGIYSYDIANIVISRDWWICSDFVYILSSYSGVFSLSDYLVTL